MQIELRFLFSVLLVTLGIVTSPNLVSASTVTFKIGVVEGGQGSRVEVPLSAMDAENLGAAQMELVYDPEVLVFQEVAGGASASQLTIDHYLAAPGRLRLVLNSSARESISGDLLLTKVIFEISGATGQQSELQLTAVEAWDNIGPEATPAVMLVTLQPGQVTVVASESLIANRSWLVFAALGIGALLLLILLASYKNFATTK